MRLTRSLPTQEGPTLKWVTSSTVLSARQQHCLKGIGIRRWVERSDITVKAEEKSENSIAVLREIPEITPPIQETGTPEVKTPEIKKPVFDIPLDNWDAIDHAILQCQSCDLAQNCIQKVPGVGDQKADLMIIGEGPGHDEDIKGEPFVGRSGQLLDKMLAAIGIARSEVFITNIVKCRPPNNRDPHVDEVQACNHFLQAQIKQIKPKVILCAGRVSAHSLLHCSDPVGRLIKEMHQLPGSDIPIKVTYHPAYLLRTPSAKAIAWQDMKTLYRILSQ